MREKIGQYFKALRISGVVIIIAVLGVVGYQLYDFYGERLGYTPQRAITDYFQALGSGDYEQVYQMTDRTHLTDIYGRPITKSEFLGQLRRLAGDEPFPFVEIESDKVYSSKAYTVYRVKLTSSVGGAKGQSQTLVQLSKSGNTWLITYPFPVILN